ncbi:MAG: FtsX-like permease family protein [Nitrospirales bacterium]|nr:FtsX-like permease family protein [Nitrospirales bacterium]
MIPVSIKLAWREIHSAWSRFLFLFLCIALGVGAIVAVDLFAVNVAQVILGDTRALLGGDVELAWRRAISDKGQKILDSLAHRDIILSHVTEIAAMATVGSPTSQTPLPKIASQLVELKAIDSAYPLYGRLVAEPDLPTAQLLNPLQSDCGRSPCFGALVQESLLIRLNLTVGNELQIGQGNFIITAVLKKEPDRIANGFSLGPRVMISREALKATALIQFGTRVQERYRLSISDSTSLEPLMGELRGRLSQEGAQVSSFRDAQPRLRRFLDQLNLYLGLIGFTILLVGGIGVACTIQGFLTQKIPIITTLKTLGADSSQIIRLYLTQSLILGVIGSLLGVIVGIVLHQGLPLLLQDIIPETMAVNPTVSPILRGLVLGTLATLAFSLWPLLAIRHVSPALVYRQTVDHQQKIANTQSRLTHWRTILKHWWNDRAQVMVSLSMLMSVTGLAMWQAHSPTLGVFFSGACAVSVLLLLGATGILYRVLRHVPIPQRYLLRHAVRNLQRPGNFTKAMTLAIGIGVMLMTTLTIVQRSLLDLIGNQIPSQAPSFFFIDIQPDQYPQFVKVLQQNFPGSPYKLVPVVRSRLTAINGQPIDPEEHKGQRNGWYFTREYVLTASRDLPKDNVLSQGEWWDHTMEADSDGATRIPSDFPLVSVEEDAAKHLGLTLGSTLTLDIQGVPIVAKVGSLRQVDWGSFSINFFMILQPGSFDGAPFTYIATTRVPTTLEVPLQQAIVAVMPNVTAINVGDVLENIGRIFHQLALGIQALALLCLVTGSIVMIAAISINRYRRLHELAIVKALGASRRLLVFSLGVEFGIIGTFAGLVGLGLGCLLSWSLLYFFFDLTWTFDLILLSTGLLLTILLSLMTGFLATYRLLGFPPLSVLRQE